jgi:hypothetical protein
LRLIITLRHQNLLAACRKDANSEFERPFHVSRLPFAVHVCRFPIIFYSQL